MSLPKDIITAMNLDALYDEVHKLKEKYPSRDVAPTTIAQILAENPDCDFAKIECIIKKEYNETLEAYLTQENLLKNGIPTWEDVICSDGHYIIPEGIREIPSEGFWWKTIKSIQFPSTLRRIQENAFSNASGTELVIPKSVRVFSHSFQSARFQSIRLGNELKAIPQGCFEFASIQSMVIPEGVTKIGHDAFRNCSELTEVSLPSTLQEIGYSAFACCSKLKTVSGKPLDQIKICPCAFDYCDALADKDGFIIINGRLYRSPALHFSKHVIIPEGVTDLSMFALSPDTNRHYRDERGTFRYGYCEEITLPRSLRRLPDVDLGDRRLRLNLPEGIVLEWPQRLNNPKYKIGYY